MRQLKSMVKAFNYYCGYYHLVDRLRRIKDEGGRLVILTYHNLSDQPKPGTVEKELFELRPSVTEREFESHLQVLKKRFKVISLPDTIREIKDKGPLESDFVAITFDDGYESFYRLAFPLLRKYDFPATVFLPTDFVSSQRAFWWDELPQIIFRAVPQPKSASLLIPLIGDRLTRQLYSAGNNPKRKKEFLESLEFYLRSVEDGIREEKTKNLKEILLPDQDLESGGLNTLTWDQVAEMVREGISLGSHTCSHLDLKFAPLKKAQEELAKSKEIIERKIKVKVDCFAYPYDADFETHHRVKSVLRDLEYECACTCTPGVNLSDLDPFFLKRIALPMTTSRPLIARELLLGYSGKFKAKLVRSWDKPGTSQAQLANAEIKRRFTVDRKSN
jgi:peptidoglycan/xylan/chitin deacetylase (PgdA/CDA1 family)